VSRAEQQVIELKIRSAFNLIQFGAEHHSINQRSRRSISSKSGAHPIVLFGGLFF
jgi:hypothetical protein